MHTAGGDEWVTRTGSDNSFSFNDEEITTHLGEHPPLKGVWEDFKDWKSQDSVNPESPEDAIEGWHNIEDYMRDRHGVSPYSGTGAAQKFFNHPVVFALAKLHSLAQDRRDIHGYGVMNDDDMLTGAALGLLKIRSQAHTASTDGIRYAHIIEADVAEDLRRLAGLNGDLPEGLTFTHRDYPRTGESSWHAHHGGEEIGSLYVMPSDHSEKGAVSNIDVHENYHRRGVATALWEAAGRPLHTPNQQTGSGQAWAQAVGGDDDFDPEWNPDDDVWNLDDDEDDSDDDSMRLAGLYGDLPENITFRHHPAGFEPFPDVIMPTVDVSSAWPTVSAHDGDKMIGHLQWDDSHPRKKGQIWDLRVHPDYQRRGVATALFDWTTDNVEPDLQHSNNLSDEGRAFAESEAKRPLAEERYEAWRNGQPMPKRFAMAWDHWAPQIQNTYGGCELGKCVQDDKISNNYHVDHGDGEHSYLCYSHQESPKGEPTLFIRQVHTNKDYRRDGVAEALMRRLHEDHPGFKIDPGGMTDQGQAFHDRMLEKEQTARDVLMDLPERTAALNQDLVNRLDKQFHDWWTDTFAARYKAGAPEVKGWLDHGDHDAGPSSHWPNIEAFLKERYPAAHKGHDMGLEEAARPLDGLGPMPYQQRGTADLTPYETGPEAVSKHGYDPAEVAASMLLLHNRSNPFRGDMEQRDVARLTDIVQKRTQMQRNYDQRQAAVNQDLVDRLRGEFHAWRKTQPKRTPRNWDGMIGGLNEWTNIEKFLKDQYPAAHRGLGAGHEMAGPLLDGRLMHLDYMMPGPLEYSTPQPYETGPEAVAQHGYDPKEIAAAMLLLHNKSDRFRGDMSQEDQARLNDIAQKRFQMQRDYDQRNARIAAAPDEAIAHAQEVLARREHYALHGAHPEGPQSLRGYRNAHLMEMTPAWAAETHYGALKQMAGAYHQAAERVLANPDDLDAHLRLLRHRDLLRVELQHSRKFAVPSLEHFSQIPDPDRHIGGQLINPRFKAGTGDPDLASQRAYMINCQRCALAADANYHGLNVEAQQRYHSPKGGHTNDYIPKDHELAAWWRDANGVPAAWIDPQDHFAVGDDGPHHWDHMTRQIASWGPGGRAVIMASYPHPHANEFVRHVFNARVGDNGQVHYLDHQIRGSSGDHYRDRVDYTALDGRSRRKNILTTDPAARIVERNKIESPLRFLRTDDKTLAPETAKFLVDRGTADGTPIFAPHDPQGDR